MTRVQIAAWLRDHPLAGFVVIPAAIDACLDAFPAELRDGEGLIGEVEREIALDTMLELEILRRRARHAV